jgi:hypothetical protein
MGDRPTIDCTTGAFKALSVVDAALNSALNDQCCAIGTIGISDELRSSYAVFAKPLHSPTRKADRNGSLARPTRTLRLP